MSGSTGAGALAGRLARVPRRDAMRMGAGVGLALGLALGATSGAILAWLAGALVGWEQELTSTYGISANLLPFGGDADLVALPQRGWRSNPWRLPSAFSSSPPRRPSVSAEVLIHARTARPCGRLGRVRPAHSNPTPHSCGAAAAPGPVRKEALSDNQRHQQRRKEVVDGRALRFASARHALRARRPIAGASCQRSGSTASEVGNRSPVVKGRTACAVHEAVLADTETWL